MWNWIIIMLLSLAVLLLIEELSQFIWRSYLREPKNQNNRKSDLLAKVRQMKQKLRKDPSL
jgi:uncharacterized protein YpmS